MKHYPCKITAEETPSRAIRGGGDVVEVTRGRDPIDGESSRAVGEDGTILDEGFVDDGAVGDDDGRGRADMDGDDGAIFGRETAQHRFNCKRRLA